MADLLCRSFVNREESKMCDCRMEIKNSPRKGKRQKKMRGFNPNIDTLSSNYRNPLGELPKDFFTNPRKYRKPDSEISR
jgi:hypothetical protein